MSTEPLNTMPIQQFLQQVKSADASRAKEIRLPIEQCKNLAFTLGIVMARLNGDLEKFLKENNSSSNEIIKIDMDSGSNWG